MRTHVDRVAIDLERWTDDKLTIVGPDDADLAEAEAAIVGGVHWGPERFDLAPRLRVLARTGIGVDAVDLDEATRRGVFVTNTPTGPTVSTAEHAIALLFSVAKTLDGHQARLRAGSGGYAAQSTAAELDGLTLGLLGFGRIARRVARIATAVGMNVIAHDPYLYGATTGDGSGSKVVESEGTHYQLVDLETLVGSADVLSLHAPLTAETDGLFDRDLFTRCKRGVILINAARGGLVVTDDLVAALDDGQVAAAGLDVTEPEPLAPDHTLLHRDNVLVTPHIASSTVVGRDRMMAMAIEQVLQVLDGQRPTNLVNPAVSPDPEPSS